MLYPAGLYKGTVWMNDGNQKLMYLGMQDQYYTFTMFDVQAEWACAVIKGIVKLPEKKTMEDDIEKWLKNQGTLKNCYEHITFQTDFVLDLAKEVECKYNLDVKKLLDKWEDDRHENIVTYRDKVFDSIFTGTPGIKHHTPWYKAFDYSLETFVKQSPNKFSAG